MNARRTMIFFITTRNVKQIGGCIALQGIKQLPLDDFDEHEKVRLMIGMKLKHDRYYETHGKNVKIPTRNRREATERRNPRKNGGESSGGSNNGDEEGDINNSAIDGRNDNGGKDNDDNTDNKN